MKYAGIIKNDLTAGPGIAVTFFVQGCHNHCKNCHNPETWDFDGGKEFTQTTMDYIISALTANGVQRHFAVMGGEPLADENLFLTDMVIDEVRRNFPNIKIYLWTGLYYEDLLAKRDSNKRLNDILTNIDILVDGPYIDDERDITLPMRGSKNQRIIELRRNNG